MDDITNLATYTVSASGSDYIRFGDGTQIVYFNGTRTDISATTLSGAGIYTGLFTWTFSRAFLAGTYPVVTVGQCKHGSSASWGAVNTATATAADIRMYDVASRAAGTTCYLQMQAVGRWK